MSPPNPQDLDHPLIKGLMSAFGWVMASLLTLLAVLAGWDRKSMNNKVTALFRWKDDVVDKALQDIPKTYVTKDDLRTYVHEPNAEAHERILTDVGEVRSMVEQLLKRL